MFLVGTGIILYLTYKRRYKKRLVPTTDFSTTETGSSLRHLTYQPLEYAAPPGEYHSVHGYSETGSASTGDFHPSTVASLHEEDHSMLPPQYEFDPRYLH